MHNQAHKLQPNVTIVQQQSKPRPNNYYTAAINHQRFIPQSSPSTIVSDKVKQQSTPSTKSSTIVIDRIKPKSSSPNEKSQQNVIVASTQNKSTTTPPIIVDNNEEWICSECGAEFRSKLRLDVHFNSFHVEDSVQKIPDEKHSTTPSLVDNNKPKTLSPSAANLLPISSSAKHLNGLSAHCLCC